jgi:hypothetical protein
MALTSYCVTSGNNLRSRDTESHVGMSDPMEQARRKEETGPMYITGDLSLTLPMLVNR